MGKIQQTDGPYWSKAWIQKLWEFTNKNFVDFDTGAVDYEALGREEYDFRKAMFFRNFKNSPRAAESFKEALEVYQKRVESGKTGGRPTNASKTKNSNEVVARYPKNKQEFDEFVYDNNLHIQFAHDWLILHKNRGWTFENGQPITNWKGALTNWCKEREANENGNQG